MRLLTFVLLLVGCSVAPAATPAPAPPAGSRLGSYTLRLDSPDSWAHYYTRIGLGNVERLPLDSPVQEALVNHCHFLTAVTQRQWIPLGMSKERGYKLCYETGPFSDREAHVFCARLVMRVQTNAAESIVCEGEPAVTPAPRHEDGQRAEFT